MNRAESHLFGLSLSFVGLMERPAAHVGRRTHPPAILTALETRRARVITAVVLALAAFEHGLCVLLRHLG